MSEGRVKHIYFIRHGETKRNRQYFHQGPDEPLTERGREQVATLIEFLRDKKIDTLISSDMKRAVETAELVGTALGLSSRVERSVREFGRPLGVYDRHYLSLPSLRYFIDLYRHRLDLLWHTDDAENLVHIRERVRDARLMLEASEGKCIAVISHRIFMTMFAETVCYDRPLSLWKFFYGLIGRKRIPNTGILHLTCEPTVPAEKKCTWFLEEVVLPPYNR